MYRVDLEVFRGPLDLLLFLVRKHEVEITEIPVGLITEQFLAHLEILKELDVNAVGDFLVMASTLVEIKSRELLPHSDEEISEPLDDPRQDLVRQLLEYKKYKDAASLLEERSRKWQDRFPRVAKDLPPRTRDLAEEPIQEVELWDLVSAFGRIMREIEIVRPSNIVYDETPIQVYMQEIHTRLKAEGRVAFSSLFQKRMRKSSVIGLFLAVLELVRHFKTQAEQDDLFGEIWLVPDADTPELIDWSVAEVETTRAIDETTAEQEGAEATVTNDVTPAAEEKAAQPAQNKRTRSRRAASESVPMEEQSGAPKRRRSPRRKKGEEQAAAEGPDGTE